MRAVEVFERRCVSLVCLLLIGQAGAAAAQTPATSTPAWAATESASVHASSVDPVHALITSVVRQRQLSPLRAARLFATVRVAQSEAVRQIARADAETISGLAAFQALSWMLPLEDSARWAVPALLSVNQSGRLVVHTEALVHAAVWPVLGHVVDDGADARRRPLAKPQPKRELETLVPRNRWN
jgi:hypothetical protein